MAKNFTIHLINVWWDESGTDTRYFNSIAEQTEYFNSLVDRVGINATLSNFNIADNITTTQNVLFDSGYDLTTMLATNYAVVREYRNNIPVNQRYYFAKCSQNSGNLLNVYLSLDDIQTNYFKVKEHIAPCEIRRACLNRFKEIDENNVGFDNSPASPMLFNEGAVLPKYLQHREFVEMPLFNSQPQIMDEYIKNHPITWCYIFIGDNPGVRTALSSWGMVDSIYAFKQVSNKLSAFFVVAVPFVNNYAIFLNDTQNYFNDLFLNEFLKIDAVAGSIIDIKYSINAPFLTDAVYGEDYKIENDNLFLTPRAGLPFNTLGFYTLSYPEVSGYKIMLVASNERNTKEFVTMLNNNDEFTFLKQEIINSVKNKKYNPKLLSSAFNEMNLVDFFGNSYTYDMQKINTNEIKLKYDEPITPGQSVGYFRVSDNLYYGDNNYCGLVFNNDNRLTYGVSQLSSFLASNRNYSQIQQAQRDYNEQVGAINGVSQFLGGAFGAGATLTGAMAMNPILGGGSVGGLIAGGAIAGKQIISGTIGLAQQLALANAKNELSLIIEGATLDNMRNAPMSLNNTQCNVMLPFITQSQMGMYIEQYKCTDADANKFNDYCVRFGFEFNQIGDLKDFDNIRKRFNYISANVGAINYPISSDEKARLRAKLNGVRFWNSDTIDYTYENYERWLEE